MNSFARAAETVMRQPLFDYEAHFLQGSVENEVATHERQPAVLRSTLVVGYETGRGC